MFRRCIVPGCQLDSCIVYLAVDRSLTAQLFQDLGCSGQSITTLANRDVEDEFLDFDVPHGICGFFIARGLLVVVSLEAMSKILVFGDIYHWDVDGWIDGQACWTVERKFTRGAEIVGSN